MYATMVTRRDTMLEGMMYVTDDLQEAQRIGWLLLRQHKGVFARTWVKGIAMTPAHAEQWWTDTAYADGCQGVPCPLVPKSFKRLYWRHFQRAELDKCANGRIVQHD